MGRPPKSEASADKQQEIIDATYEIILEKGVNNTSVADIVNRVGISKGTFFYYYKSKDQLIYDLTMQHLNRLSDFFLQRLSVIKETNDIASLLTEVITTFIQEENPGRLNLYLICNAVTGNDELFSCFRNQYLAWQKSLMEALMSNCKVDNSFCRDLSFIIPALIDGFTIQWLLGMRDFSISSISSRIV